MAEEVEVLPFQILSWLGWGALAAAAVLLALAARTFFREDIRGVMADLSGRRRAAGIAAGRDGGRRAGYPGSGMGGVRPDVTMWEAAARPPETPQHAVHLPSPSPPPTFRITRRVLLLPYGEDDGAAPRGDG